MIRGPAREVNRRRSRGPRPLLGPEIIGGIQGESAPNEDEGGGAIARERLVKEPDPEGELHRGCDVLQQPEGGETDAPGTVGKEQQRYRRDHAGADQEHVLRQAHAAQRPGAGVLLPEDEEESEGSQQQGLQSQPGERAEG